MTQQRWSGRSGGAQQQGESRASEEVRSLRQVSENPSKESPARWMHSGKERDSSTLIDICHSLSCLILRTRLSWRQTHFSKMKAKDAKWWGLDLRLGFSNSHVLTCDFTLARFYYQFSSKKCTMGTGESQGAVKIERCVFMFNSHCTHLPRFILPTYLTCHGYPVEVQYCWPSQDYDLCWSISQNREKSWFSTTGLQPSLNFI
jgi:hypothetical protein